MRHHPEHQPVAEDAGLAEHTPHCDATERSELLAQELGKLSLATILRPQPGPVRQREA